MCFLWNVCTVHGDRAEYFVIKLSFIGQKYDKRKGKQIFVKCTEIKHKWVIKQLNKQ